MKKLLLPLLGLLSLGTSQVACGQVNFIRLGMNAATLARRAGNKDSTATTASAAATSASQSKTFPMQRTAAAQLPKKGAEQITALEAQLESCHAAMLASPTGVVCPPEQRKAIQQAAVSVARAQANWDLQPYQQEMAFYLAEDARRQQAAGGK